MMYSDALIPQQGTLADLQAWVAADLATAVGRLYANNVQFDPTFTVANYVEASFPGYIPAIGPTWTSPFINTEGKAEVDWPDIRFSLASPSGAYPVYGFYLTNVANTKLFAVFPFNPPYTFSRETPLLSFGAALTCVSEL